MATVPDSAIDAARRAEALISMRRSATAVQLLASAIAAWPADPRLYCLLAQAQLQGGEPRAAGEAAKQAIVVAPEYEWAFRLLAKSLLALAKTQSPIEAVWTRDSAAQAAQRAVELAPALPSTHIVRAEAELEANNWAAARQAAATAVHVGPQLVDTHVTVSLVALRSGDFETAERAARRALSLDAGCYAAVNNLGAALRGQGRFLESTRLFASAARLNPEGSVARRNLASSGLRFAWRVIGALLVIGLIIAYATSPGSKCSADGQCKSDGSAFVVLMWLALLAFLLVIVVDRVRRAQRVPDGERGLRLGLRLAEVSGRLHPPRWAVRAAVVVAGTGAYAGLTVAAGWAGALVLGVMLAVIIALVLAVRKSLQARSRSLTAPPPQYGRSASDRRAAFWDARVPATDNRPSQSVPIGAPDDDLLSSPDSARCSACGAAPVLSQSIMRVVGRLVRYRYDITHAPLCRTCGIATIRDATDYCLLRGWWSPVSFFVTFGALATNLQARRAYGRLDPPEERGTNSPGAREVGRPVFLRKGTGVLLVLTVGLGSLLLAGAVSSINSSHRELVGSCVQLDRRATDGLRRLPDSNCPTQDVGLVVQLAAVRSDCLSPTHATRLAGLGLLTRNWACVMFAG